jgi:GNAT superfamily N-acetyltransferase
MSYDIVTLQEEPSLQDKVNRIHRRIWPPFLLQDPVSLRYWDRLLVEFAEYQLVLLEKGKVIGAGHSIPIQWVGAAMEDLPEGWDAALERGFANQESPSPPTALVGLSLVVAPEHQGKNLSRMILSTLKDMAVRKELRDLIVPVRPTFKSRYPRMAMGDYLSKFMRNGLPFDPWVRTHVKLGAKFLSLAHRSMVVTGTVKDWEAWTGRTFKRSGKYVVEGGLVTVTIDRRKDHGVYEEPNIWVRYELGG